MLNTASRHRIGRAILVSSALAVAAVVASSLNPEHYFFGSSDARRGFVPEPRDVASAFFLSAGEAAVLYVIVCVGQGARSWRRLLIGLVVFVPWVFVAREQIGTHVPGFLMINALWVALIVIFLTGALLALWATHILRLTPRSETRRPG